ncbi:hypothetical protein FB45DRAFT_929754 [Roridomyces roridus]|uniref:Cytochrome b561 domain-containing protein n=1 Tax=Roridomyces roridus TaxID=1738132 RepID=A0AAD7FHB7_9AGAR|nr:hypothetical protein FB45DRAFT_929754 [Roridomyces roridus]
MSLDFHDKMIVAHAVLAGLAALITAPAAILIGRYFRSRQWWFKAHLFLQIITAIFIITLFAVGLLAVASGGNGNQLTGPKKDPHHDIGLAIAVLFLLQFVLGIGAHLTHSAGPGKYTLTTPKSPLRHVHVGMGLVVTALLYAGVKTGMDEWNNVSDAKTLVPKGVEVVYWVLFALAVAAYLFGWILEPMRAASRESSVVGSEEKVDGWRA